MITQNSPINKKGTLNFDIGRWVSEDLMIEYVSNVYCNHKWYWPSYYCNDTYITEHSNKTSQNNKATNPQMVR